MAQPIQPFLNLQTFSGAETENIDQFERQLRSCIGLAQIDAANQHLYLHLHLKGNALTFYDQLAQATREDLDLALTALRERYVGPERVEFYKLQFQNRKFNKSKETIQDYLTELQRLANLAFPNIAARAAAGGLPAIAAEDRANDRTRRVKEAFINGMPNKLKKYLLTLQEATPVEQHCEKASKRLMLDDQFPEDDSESAFNEISTSQFETIVASISAINKSQKELKESNEKLNQKLSKLENKAQAQDVSSSNWNTGRYGQNYQGIAHAAANDPPFDWQGMMQQMIAMHHGVQPNNNGGNFQSQGGSGNGNFNRSNGRGNRRRFFCDICGKYGHTPKYCWYREQAERDQKLPFDKQPKN